MLLNKKMDILILSEYTEVLFKVKTINSFRRVREMQVRDIIDFNLYFKKNLQTIITDVSLLIDYITLVIISLRIVQFT